jgi:uncharacterized protein YheU (UPF0270 family)
MIIPYTMLSPDTLRGIVEEFVLREGTDYGYGSSVGSESGKGSALDGKVAQVMKQLELGDVAVIYDESTESCDLVTKGSKRFLGAAAAAGEKE